MSATVSAPGRIPARYSIARDLARLRRHGRTRAMTLRDAMQVFAERSTPLLLLFLGLLGFIPSPGLPLGLFTGMLVICAAAGLLWRARHPPIPDLLARRELPAGLLRRFMLFAIPFVRKLERYFRPRLTWLVSGFGVGLAAIGLIVQGIGLALPIPFGNAPFALGIVLIALGLLTRDGLGALAGHLVGIASMALFVTLGLGLVKAGTSLSTLLPW